MNGSLAGIAFVAAVIGTLIHVVAAHVWPGKDEKSRRRRHVAERVAAVVFFAVAMLAVLAAAPSIMVLWQVTETGQGLVVLLSLLLISGVLAVLMVWRGHHHHRVGTTAVAVMFGLTAGLTAGGWHQVTRAAGAGAVTAGSGIAAAVLHGHAAAAVHGHSAHHAVSLTSGTNLYVIAGAVLAVIGCAVAFFRTRPARPNAKKNQQDAGRRPRGGDRGLPSADRLGAEF